MASDAGKTNVMMSYMRRASVSTSRSRVGKDLYVVCVCVCVFPSVTSADVKPATEEQRKPQSHSVLHAGSGVCINYPLDFSSVILLNE